MPKNRNQRQEEAKQRIDLRNQRSPEEQLRLLDNKLGTGKGAKKERARLIEQISSKKNTNVSKKKKDK